MDELSNNERAGRVKRISNLPSDEAGCTPECGSESVSVRPKITFFGHFGGGNFGNESTLLAALYNLRRLLPDAEFSCICSAPDTVAMTYAIDAVPNRDIAVKPWVLDNPLAKLGRKLIGVPMELRRWLKSLKTLRGTDALVVAGTGLLTDAYTLFYWGPYDMFRWSVTAKFCGCKLLFVSVGVGPLYSRIGRFFVKAALSLADFRSYRDASSLEYLRGIGFAAENDKVYPDLAFSLPTAVVPGDPDTKSGRPVVGLGLMEYAGKYSVERPTSATYSAYMESLVELVKWLLAHEFDVRLLIGDLADTRVTQEFRSMLKRSVSHDEGRIIDEPVESVEDLLSQLAATDFVVATRFHNVLLSLLLNRPVIAISFHHKCSSLMSQMGLAEYCQDINDLSADRLIEQFCQLQQNAVCVKRMIKEKVRACQDVLDEQYGIIFSDICPDRQQATQPATEIRHNPNSSVLL
jgi:polysaccharide pyruvyl transferase WcaK-like protein